MNIAILGERLAQNLVTAEVRQEPQLDLGVVGCQQQPPLRRQERLTNLPALLAAHGDILQVRIAGR